MPIISLLELSTIKTTYERFSNGQVQKDLRNFSTRTATQSEVTVFLSHKHDEVEPFESVIALLKSLGVNIYVDWQDSEMPTSTSGETARRIKKKIQENKKFILLATERAIASKWCNWELGYGDAWKFPNDQIAILPIKNNDKSYSGSEYLQIYPSIQYDSYGNLFLFYPDYKTPITLANWLKK